MRRRFRYFFCSVRFPGDREERSEGAVGSPLAPCRVVPCRTLLPLAVVGPKGLVAGGVRVQELEGVLGDVLLHQQLVVADDVGQRQGCQLGRGVGNHCPESGGPCGVGGRWSQLPGQA